MYRPKFSYNALQKGIIEKLEETGKLLKKFEYEAQPISPREFYDYMTGDTPTGDITTIVDVLGSQFLMIHEVVEISELKKGGVIIDENTVMKLFPSIYEQHLTATEYEMKYALHKKDYEWLELRLNHAKSWLEDAHMPQHVIPRCKAIIKKISEALDKEKETI